MKLLLQGSENVYLDRQHDDEGSIELVKDILGDVPLAALVGLKVSVDVAAAASIAALASPLLINHNASHKESGLEYECSHDAYAGIEAKGLQAWQNLKPCIH